MQPCVWVMLPQPILIPQGCYQSCASRSHPVGPWVSLHFMSDAEVWLVAGGEPGAERFGSLVQRLRKDQGMSVGEVAEGVGLSVGTIRAIEQGRRAPSEESGVRLLKLLLPAETLEVEPTATTGTRELRPDITFLDPGSHTQIVVEFKAKTAGDNRRWSSDKPPAQETETEARLREFLADPVRMNDWRKGVQEALGPTVAAFGVFAADLRARAARPASDADFGKIVRRLAEANEFDLERVGLLLDIWARAKEDAADERARNHAFRVNAILNEYQVLPHDDVELSSE